MTDTISLERDLEERSTRARVPRWIAWFEIVVGTGMLGLWITLIVSGQVPEIPAGESDIWFHLVAEFVTAALLLGGGALAVLGRPAARSFSLLALGALLYTTINSAGFYADRSDWVTVGMFMVLALVAAAASGAVVRPS